MVSRKVQDGAGLVLPPGSVSEPVLYHFARFVYSTSCINHQIRGILGCNLVSPLCRRHESLGLFRFSPQPEDTACSLRICHLLPPCPSCYRSMQGQMSVCRLE